MFTCPRVAAGTRRYVVNRGQVLCYCWLRQQSTSRLALRDIRCQLFFRFRQARQKTSIEYNNIRPSAFDFFELYYVRVMYNIITISDRTFNDLASR